MICQRSAFVFPGGRMAYYFRYSYPLSQHCIPHTLLLFHASWIMLHDSDHVGKYEILIDPSNFFAMRYLYGAGKHQLLYTTQKWLSPEKLEHFFVWLFLKGNILEFIFLGYTCLILHSSIMLAPTAYGIAMLPQGGQATSLFHPLSNPYYKSKMLMFRGEEANYNLRKRNNKN